MPCTVGTRQNATAILTAKSSVFTAMVTSATVSKCTVWVRVFLQAQLSLQKGLAMS